MSENRTAKHQIKIRLTADELTRLKKKIEKSGLSQQEYIKRCALEKPIINTDGIKILMPELKRVGNNLNQIARKMNEGFYPTIEEVNRSQEELIKLWQLLRHHLNQKHR